MKQDEETGKTIPYAGAGFKIYDPDGNPVTMTFTYPTPTTIDTAYFLRLIQLVSMLYDCRNIIALCALKTNITQNMGRPHCAATLILILL